MDNKSITRLDTRMEFARWLEKELKTRGMSQAELARRAGVVRSTISAVISGARGPGPDLIQGVARAFKMPPETVYRIAELLPPATAEEEVTAQILADLGAMHPEDQKEIAEYIRFKREQADLKKKENPVLVVP